MERGTNKEGLEVSEASVTGGWVDEKRSVGMGSGTRGPELEVGSTVGVTGPVSFWWTWGSSSSFFLMDCSHQFD